MNPEEDDEIWKLISMNSWFYRRPPDECPNVNNVTPSSCCIQCSEGREREYLHSNEGKSNAKGKSTPDADVEY
jgi:hypothetical protein